MLFWVIIWNKYSHGRRLQGTQLLWYFFWHILGPSPAPTPRCVMRIWNALFKQENWSMLLYLAASLNNATCFAHSYTQLYLNIFVPHYFAQIIWYIPPFPYITCLPTESVWLDWNSSGLPFCKFPLWQHFYQCSTQ